MAEPQEGESVASQPGTSPAMVEASGYAREPNQAEFFVGYLPLPPRLKRFTAALAGALLVLVVATAAASSALREPPAGSTQVPNASLVGLVEARAYGILWALEGQGAPRPVLLSRGGKFGAPDAVTRLAGKVVRLDGLLLERGEVRLLEVGKVDPNPRPSEPTSLREIPRVALGTKTLRGEIVELKCWLGRMKPGDGRTHRACAQFCIAGGIPPVLVSRDQAGAEQRYVLTARDGGPVNEAVLPYVAEAVELRGALDSAGGLLFLRIDPADIRRL